MELKVPLLFLVASSLVCSAVSTGGTLSGIEFTQTSFTVTEGNTLNLMLTITTDSGVDLEADTDIMLVTSPVSTGATLADLQPVSAIVTIPMGTTPVTEMITVSSFTAFDDSDPEDAENFVIFETTFSVLTVVQINDNDNVVTVELDQASYNINEGAGSVVVCAVLGNVGAVGGSTSAEVTSNFVLSMGTTEGAPDDYVMPSAAELSISFPALSEGGETDCVSISIISDDVVEGPEFFTVSLEDPLVGGVSGMANLVSPSSSPVSITDDDEATVQIINTAFPTANMEGTDATIMVTLTSLPGGGLGETLSVMLQTTTAGIGGTPATAVDDFGALSLSQIDFTPGGSADQTAMVTISLVDDSLFEDEESFIVTISSVSIPSVTASPSSGTVIIEDIDADDVIVSMAIASTTANEGDLLNVCAEIDALPTNGADPNLGLSVPITSPVTGTATMGADFGLPNPSQITFSAPLMVSNSACAMVTINNDLALEGDQNFFVNLVAPTLPVGVSFGTVQSTEVTISDEDIDNVITMSSTSETTSEDVEDNVMVCASIAGVDSFEISPPSIDMSLIDGTLATDGNDFSSASLTATFATTPFGNEGCITVTIMDDDDFEGMHAFSVMLSDGTQDPSTLQIGGADTTVITITDENDATVTFQMSSTSIPEPPTTAGPIAVTLELELPTAGSSLLANVVVFVSTLDGTAAAPGDYDSISSMPVTFTAPATTPQQLSVTINPDMILEGNQAFTVELDDPPTGYTIGTPGSFTITITDDDAGLFDANVVLAPSFDEDGSGLFAIIATASSVPSGGFETEVTIPLTVTGDGTAAFEDEDYSFVSPLEIVFSTSTVMGGPASQSAAITIIDDSVLEGDHSFTVVADPAMSNPPGILINGVSMPLSRTVTITDDEADNPIEITTPDTETMEDDEETFSVCAIIVGVTDIQIATPVTVDLMLTTTVLADLSDVSFPASPATITFAQVAGPPPAVEACLSLTIINDDNFEGDHSFTVGLAPATEVPLSLTFGSDTSVEFVITDNQDATVQFADVTSAIDVNEGVTIQLAIVLDTPNSGQLEVPIQVDAAATDGDKAILGSDYNQQQFTVNFIMGDGDATERMSTQSVSIIADSALEGPHSFDVTIILTSFLPYSVGTRRTLTVNIMDTTDLAAFVFSMVSLTAAQTPVEGPDSMVNVCGVVFFVGITLECDVEVEVVVMDTALAVEGTDFISPASLVYTFDTSTVSGENDCLTFNISDDSFFEGDHSFVVSVSPNPTSPPGITIGTPNSVDVTIEDDDVTVQMITNDTRTIEIDEDTLMICAEFPDVDMFEIEASVEVMVTPGPLVMETVDFEAPSGFTAIFPAGAAAPACVNIGILDDNCFEGDHSFVATLVTPTPPSIVIDPSMNVVTVTIDDTDDATVTLRDEEVIGCEGDIVMLCASLSVAKPIQVELRVSFNLSDGSATLNDNDFSSMGRTATFEVGAENGDEVCLNVTLLSDDILEAEQTFEGFIVENTEPPSATIGDNPDTTLITIIDKNLPDATVGFNQSEYSGVEGDSVEVCVELSAFASGGSEVDVVVTLSLFDGSKSVEGDDYVLDGPNPLTFMPGDFATLSNSQRCTNIDLIDDSTVEGGHDFTVHLNVEPSIVVDVVYATINIEDINTAYVSFPVLTYNAQEDQTDPVEVCVEISDIPAGGLECDVTVTLGSVDGTKTVLGDDFTLPSPFSVVFPSGTTMNGDEVCVNITIVNDLELEGDEQIFTVEILSVSPSNVIAHVNTTSVTIADDDADDATVGFEFLDIFAMEGQADNVLICVQIFDIPTEGLACPVNVTLSLIEEMGLKEAIEGSDFVIIGSLELEFDTDSVDGDLECATVSIIEDMTLEGTHGFGVVIDSTSPDINIDPSAGSTVVFIEDIDDGEIEFSGTTTFLVPEDGSDNDIIVCVNFTSLAANGLECNLTLQFSTVPLTALPPGDFTPSFIPFTVPAMTGLGEEVCDVVQIGNIVDDYTVEDTESFLLVLVIASIDTVAFGAQDAITIGIIDDDEVTLSFTEREYTVEELSSIEIFVEIEGYLQREVIVDVLQEAVFDILLGDSQQVTFTTLTIGQGANFANTIHGGNTSFNFNANDDSIKENIELFLLCLVSSDPAAVFGRDIAIVSIPSNGVISASITSDDLMVSEGDGVVRVCVEVDHLPQTDVIITLSTVEGTATASEDYYPLEKDLVFGFEFPTTQCVYIPILNDECLEEKQEVFSVELSSDQACVTFDISTANVTIYDDDSVLLRFEEIHYSVEEPNDSVQVCVEVCDGELKRNAPFTVKVENGSALRPDDYDADAVTQLEFTPDNFNSTLCIDVSIENDTILEYAEYFSLSLCSDDPYVTFKDEVSVVWIEDDDCATITISQESYTVMESAGYFEVCVTLLNDTERTVEALGITVQGTAQDGFDYFGGTETFFFFPSGESEQCTNITIIPDDVLEEPEMFSLVLTSTDDGIKVDRQTAPVFILDNAMVTIGFTQDVITMIEDDGMGGNSVVMACIGVLTGQLDRNVVITVSTSDGSAVAGEDYVDFTQVITTIDLTFESNFFTVANEECVPVTILADDCLEEDEYFSLSLDTDDSDVVLFPNTTMINIEDNDSVNVSFTQDVFTFNEGDGVASVCVELSGGLLKRDVEVFVSTSQGSAFDPDDFLGIVNTPVTFLSGDSVGTMQCVNVTLVDEDVVESDQEFSVQLSTSDPVLLAPFATATVVIEDNDDLGVSFQESSYTTGEPDGFVQICVEITSGTLERDVFVGIETQNGSAIAGEDYESLMDAQVEFTSGSGVGAIECQNVTIINDDFVEDEETFSVEIVASAGQPVIVDGNGTASVVIEQDPADTVNVSFVQAVYDVNEEDGVVHVCIELSGGTLQRSIEVLLSTSDDSAIDSSDYEGIQDSPIAFQSGDAVGTTQCVNITLINEDVVEPSQQFFVSLGSNDQAAEFNPIAQTTVVIEDVDELEVKFEQLSYPAQEPIGFVEICVEISSGSLERDVLVTLQTVQDDNAIADEDYVSQSADVEFTSGSGVGTIECKNVSIINDGFVEDEETFSVEIVASAGQPVIVDGASTASVMIEQDPADTVDFSFVQSVYNVNEEDDAFARVCVELSGGTLQRSIEVLLSTADDSAIDSSDYEGIQDSPIAFQSGDAVGTTQCVNITLINEDVVEPSQQFFVSLDSNDQAAEFNPIAQTTVVIEDVDELEVKFEQLMYPAQEPLGFVEICVEISSGSLERDVLVTLQTVQDDNAIADEDYVSQSADVEFTSGSGVGTIECKNVTIINDGFVEDEETFSVEIMASAGQPVIVDGASTASVVIEQDPADTVEFEFELTAYEVDEGNNITVCVNLVSGTLQRDAEVTVTSTEVSEAIGGGQDFEDVSAILNFSDTVSQSCLTVQTVDDIIYEDDEMFILMLSSLDDAITFGSSGVAPVTILDDDPVTIDLSGPESVCEGDGEVKFTVTVLSPFEREVIASVETSDVTTTSIDYTDVSLDLTFDDEAENEMCFTVDITDDGISESCKSFNVSLASSSPRVVIENPYMNVVLYDDDPVEFCFTGDTPHSDGDTLEVEYALTGCAQLTCGTNDAADRDCSPPEGLGTNFISILEASTRRPTRDLTIQVEPFCGQDSQTIIRPFRSDNDQCSAHLINKGVTIMGSNATFEWEGTGPDDDSGNTVNVFTCRLDGDNIGACSSPFTLPNLDVGPHFLQINADFNSEPGCLLRFYGRTVQFTIDA